MTTDCISPPMVTGRAHRGRADRSTGGLPGHLVRVVEAAPSEALLEEWRDLYDRCPGASAASSPDWAIPLLAAPGLAGRPFIVELREEGRLIAIMVLRRRRLGWTMTVEPLDLFRRGGPALLVRGELPEPARRAAARRLADALLDDVHVRRVRRLDIDETDALAAAFLERLGERGFTIRPRWSAPRHWIELPGSFEEYLQASKSARRRRVLRQEMSRAERRGPVRVERLAGDAITEAHWRRMGAIDERSWLRRRGAPSIGEPWGGRLLLGLARRGGARAWILTIGDRDVAFAMGSVEHDRFCYEYTAFDAAWANVSPGKLVTARAIEDCCAEGLRRFDFGIGDAEYKRFWANRRDTVRRIVAGRGALFAAGTALHAAAYAALSRPSIRPASRRVRGAVRRIRQSWRMIKTPGTPETPGTPGTRSASTEIGTCPQ